MSLSVIGVLLLGEFSISSGWFIPQTILCMAIVALASFTQPSIELGYGMKFMRILILVGSYVMGIYGAVVAVILSILWIASTKTIGGTSYLYPLVPFKWEALKRLIFRTKK
jgi:stage V sporulation protein AF